VVNDRRFTLIFVLSEPQISMIDMMNYDAPPPPGTHQRDISIYKTGC